MASIIISVPEPLREWVDRRVESGRYGDASQYLGELIRRDRIDSDEREGLVAELERGEASGISERRVPDILSALKREAGDGA